MKKITILLLMLCFMIHGQTVSFNATSLKNEASETAVNDYIKENSNQINEEEVQNSQLSDKVEQKNEKKEEFTSEELKIAKKQVGIQEDFSENSVQSFSVDKYFVYSNNSCDTMNLHNPETLGVHTYIDCLGYLMEYLGENSVDSNFYDVRFQGTIHAINKKDILKMLSGNSIKSFPYYVNTDGYVEHYIERNPEEENSYIYISKMGEAPNWMKKDVKYYSFSGIYFVDSIDKLGEYTQQKNAINSDAPYYDYYNYLPIRSKTSYTGDSLNSAFNYFYDNSGYSASVTVMRNTGANFVETQNKYGTNALLVIAMGIHESAYGTSNFARDRNNLFGVDAVDSNPGGAAYFSSISEGIREQGNYLSWVYADSDYASGSNYYGANLGNKGSGMNVKYASDPFWGEKIASIGAKIDRYLGSEDYQKYGLSIAKQNSTVYWNGNGTDKAFTYKNSTSLLTYMYPVITLSSSDWVQITMEPPYNDARIVGTRYPDGGAFNFNNRGYISKSNILKISEERKNENIIRDGDFVYYLTANMTVGYAERVQDNQKKEIILFYPNTKYNTEVKNNIKYIFYLNPTGTILYAQQESQGNRNVLKYFEYLPGTKYGDHIKKESIVYYLDTNSEISYAEKIKDGSIEYVASYYSGAKFSSNKLNYMKYIIYMNSDKTIKYAREQEKETMQIKQYVEYEQGTKYGAHENKESIRYYINSKGKIGHAEKINKGIVQYIAIYYEGADYAKNKLNYMKYISYLNADGTIQYAREQEKETMQIRRYIEFEDNTKYGEHANKESIIYYMNANNRIGHSEKYIGAVLKEINIYYSGAIYRDNNISHIKYNFILEPDRTIIKADEYEINSHKKIKTYYYNVGTKYGDNHNQKISKVVNY